MRKRLMKLTTLAIVASMSISMLSGCGSKTDEASTGGAASSTPTDISIMLTSYTTNIIANDSPVLKKLEELTNTKLKFTWIPSTSYADKLNITLASGDLPNVLLIPDKTASILSGVKAGAFWDIGPYLKDYPNLSKMNKDVLASTAIDGKNYGIFRARAYGRNGITYRKDWLANVGLTEPKTIDDFYNMVKAFTNNDPDKNGKNDTYGLAASKSNMVFNMMLPWFGAPNKWGEDASGKLEPDFTTTGFKDTLKFWKKLYDEKLINQDFAVFEPTKVADMFNTGKVGALIDVADQAQRSDETMVKADKTKTGVVDVMGAVEGTTGSKNLPTSGYNGMFFFPKSSNKTEADLKKTLKFMDELDNKEEQILLNNGIQDVTFKLVDGFTQPLDTLPAPTILAEINQLGLGVSGNKAYLPKQTPVRIKVAKIQEENLKTTVANPAAAYVSKTYTTNGAQLDNIIEDARVKFIVGQIDEKGFDAAVALWKKSGGDAVIKEYNEQAKLYKK